ncbi:MAG TPA: hypothetical protein VH500_02385 [Nitrososphaeraceae archaeon]
MHNVEQKHKHLLLGYILVSEKDVAGSNKHPFSHEDNASKELTELEEISARINTLIDMLHEKGVLNKKVFERTLAMRLHEISKATVFSEMSD